MKYRWTTLVSVCTHLIHARTDAEAQRLWMMTAHHLLELYIRPSDVSEAACCTPFDLTVRCVRSRM